MKTKRLTISKIIKEIRELANTAASNLHENKKVNNEGWLGGFYKGRAGAYICAAKWLAYAAGLRSSLK